jgi:hypothetical protein
VTFNPTSALLIDKILRAFSHLSLSHLALSLRQREFQKIGRKKKRERRGEINNTPLNFVEFTQCLKVKSL